MAPSPRIADPDEVTERTLAGALRVRGGRATLGDLVRDTGLATMEAENTLRTMLGLYESHLAVDEQGELLYLFGPLMIRRRGPGTASLLRRLAGTVGKLLVLAFKVSTMVILVGYVLAFCILIVAALVAILFVGEDGGLLDLGDLGDADWLSSLVDLLMFWDVGSIEYVAAAVVGPDARAVAPDHGELRYAADMYRVHRTKRPHFYEAVFAFVFGPTIPDPPHLAGEREILATIQSSAGVLTLTDLIARTGSTVAEADREMARLMVAYDGDVTVTDSGTLLYTFQSLRVTAGSEGLDNSPAPPAWHRFEARRALTGNTTGRNLLIGAMALFTLVMSLLSPVVIFPLLNVGAIGVALLAIVPFLVSLTFFVAPLLRAFSVGAENARRFRRDLRRALLFVVYEHLDSEEGALPLAEIAPRALAALTRLNDRPADAPTMVGLERATPALLGTITDTLLAELDAELEADDQGTLVVRFPRQRAELREAETLRDELGRGLIALDTLVYSSADPDGAHGEPPVTEKHVEVETTTTVEVTSHTEWNDDSW